MNTVYEFVYITNSLNFFTMFLTPLNFENFLKTFTLVKTNF